MSISALAERVPFVRIHNSAGECHSFGRFENAFRRGARASAGRAKIKGYGERLACVLSKGNMEGAATNKRRSEEQSHGHMSSGFRH